MAEIFLEQCAQAHGGDKRRLSPQAQRAILDYAWPGNVRELKHMLERACIFTQQRTLDLADLFEGAPQVPSDDPVASSLADYLRGCERRYVYDALIDQQWQIAQTAEKLGISRKNLWEKMKKLQITAPDDAER